MRCFNVESEGELEPLSHEAVRWAARAQVSLRVNPDVDAGTHPYISTGLKDNKFGIAHDQALAVYRRAAALPGMQVVGIDCHIGSQITQIEPYLDALDRLLDLVEAVEAAGIPHPPFDLGGGLGIHTPTRRRRRPTNWCAAAAAHRRARPWPPRVADRAGPLAGRQRRRAADRGAVPEAWRGQELLHRRRGDERPVRPAMYQAWMAIEPCRAARRRSAGLGRGRPGVRIGRLAGPRPRIGRAAGDMLAVLSAGAYGMAMARNYNAVRALQK